ncbi:MAG: HAMP domain-containing histidine kinase [Flavobacteriales bacterium]|nr:HAMP domain-containing histidine kinase [Flavobacteriales bacterium]
MNRSTINIVIIMAIVSLTGIIVTQSYWVRRAYSMQEKEFNDRVSIAMSSVVQRIMALNEDSSIVEPVEQVSSSFFVANINDTLHPYLLETLLREEFQASNLQEDFEYGIYDCFNDSIVFGGKVNFEDEIVHAEQADVSIQKKFDKDGHYFGIYFPSKTGIIVRQMDFWLFSSFVILVIVIFFAYTIYIILKQKRLSEVKTDFINNMTHELKTPISTIGVSAGVLLKDNIVEDPERLHRYAQIIENENNRLKTQVDKVLQLASLSPDKVDIKSERLDMQDIVSKACSTYGVKVGEKGGTLSMAQVSDPLMVRGDRVHITNIVYNLLDNACKYAEGAPAIDVSLTAQQGWVVLSVQDHGIGIDKKHQSNIFEKFYRVPTGNVHNVKGFGLGLYYVYTIVRAHQGKIELESTPGKGSTFKVFLKREQHEQ